MLWSTCPAHSPSEWSTRPSSGPAALHMPSSQKPCCASCSINPFLFLLSSSSGCRSIDASPSGGGPKFLWMIVLEPFHTPDLLLDFQRPENEVSPWDLPYFLCSCHWCQIPAWVESLPLLKLFSFLCLSLVFPWMYILTFFRLNMTLYSSSGFPFDLVWFFFLNLPFVFVFFFLVGLQKKLPYKWQHFAFISQKKEKRKLNFQFLKT